MKWIACILLILGLMQEYYGAIDPRYKEVMQRGYEFVDGDSVRFPDGSVCHLDDFNEGTCGIQWMTNDYCVPQGAYVWDGPCCDGLMPYLPEGMAGQATCQPIEEIEAETLPSEEDSGSSWWMSFFAGVLLIFAVFLGLAIYARKQKMK
jgi:hypothetical protein